ncbi:hypothetical protein LTR37_014456 [Vermiconidia calcicola]|uniref:Uncharacterized protein n=1 Tax=Vermiconidia calcicola TaxID=1690605 RepID=A0ACC3MUU2_9PEZI|nr:hypothetical protein LTR37_014456 [Vermiconidia calcicola]
MKASAITTTTSQPAAGWHLGKRVQTALMPQGMLGLAVASHHIAPRAHQKYLHEDSLAAMFEDFVEKQGQTQDGGVPKVGVVFFSGSSPLTFALEELQRPEQASLYDPGLSTKDHVLQRNAHPAHMSLQDLAWLKSKGAFDAPSQDISEPLVAAFLDRFFPLYSIVDRDSFVQLHEQQKLPWILLHAVCFIGATFCDSSVVHKAGFKSRWHMRRLYYDKAKVMFDVGYETNRVTLLQTVLVLSFWGPQMQSYWNPCSWIGFAVTIAESLGINRYNPSAQVDARTKGLLRRLWWTLAVRDAYCAALLGRPFRINIAQCDTEMPKLSDFNHDASRTGTACDHDCHTHCLYQIEMVKLSLILRKVVELRFGPSTNPTTVDELHRLSDKWQAELPQELDWSQNSASNNVLASSLRIIFNHHLIFIHMGKPSTADDLGAGVDVDSTSFKIAESAAQSISMTALTLMTNSMVGLMPHEIFPGFFIAGIVFYRRFRQSQDGYAQLYRAALDNCQMVINEARERWDPALWAVKIFDFLLSGAGSVKTAAPAVQWHNEATVTETPLAEDSQVEQDTTEALALPDYNALHSINFESPQFLDGNNQFSDILLMPSYFGPTTDAWFRNDLSFL